MPISHLLRGVVVILACLPQAAFAESLDRFFPSLVSQVQANFRPVIVIQGGGSPGTFQLDAGQFVSGLFDASGGVKSLSQEIESQFQRVPIGSTVNAFTFQFDTNLNVFTQTTEGLGPLTSERAQTAGKGKLNVSFAYAYADFSVFEGQDLDHLNVSFGKQVPFVITGETNTQSAAFANGGQINFSANLALGQKQALSFTGDGTGISGANGAISGVYPPGLTGGTVEVPAVQSNLDARVLAQSFALYFNYGITDKIDAGVIIPILDIDLSGKVATQGLVDDTGAPLQTSTSRQHDSSVGLGDITARVKANLWESDYVDLGVRGDVILPTGDKQNFRGLGDPAFGVMGIASKNFSWLSPHINAGFLVLTNDVHGDLFRMTAGTDIQPFKLLTLSADFVGDIKLDPDGIGNQVYSASGGIKFNPWRRLVLSAGALVRLNHEGLRADVIPSGAIEYTFF